MAASYQNPAEYIGHHLTFFTKPIGDGGFWTLNVDTILVSIVTGLLGLGFFWWVAKGATSGVPTKRQAFVEVVFGFIDDQVKGIFHGDRHKFVAPLAFTVFVWVLLMNSMDFLPVDLFATMFRFAGIGEPGHEPYFRVVPTADLNGTFGMALVVTFAFEDPEPGRLSKKLPAVIAVPRWRRDVWLGA